MAKKNQSLEKIWEKWGYTGKLLAVAWVAFLIAGIMRESIAMGLEEKSYDVLQSQAKKIAGLKKNITSGKIRKIRSRAGQES